MGVIGLWNLIEDSGSKVNIELLNGKVLAVDLSIWINQAIKGFRDKDGRAVENAHILGLFHRLCKLLFYNIKPIFVFDGESSTLKSRTLFKRHEKTRRALERSKNISLNVLEKYVNTNLGNSTTLLSAAKNKLKLSGNNLLSELFLPPKSKHADIYQEFVQQIQNTDNDESKNSEKKDQSCRKNNDESDHDLSYHHFGFQNVRDIDINSASFKSLPASTRYEILREIRESYKGRKNPFPEMLPSESDTFSQFQMKKLLKKRSLQEEIDKLIEELNGIESEVNVDLMRNSSNLIGLDVINSNTQTMTGGRLASDEATRFLLIKSKPNEMASSIESEQEISIEGENAQMEEQSTNSKNLAYDLPNVLVGSLDNSFQNDFERIEHLSQSSTLKNNESSQIQSKLLVGHLDKNIKMLSSNEESKLNLSDSDSSSGSDDFIEVEPIDLHNSFENDESNVLEDSLLLPYDTSYQMNISIEEHSLSENADSNLTTTIEAVSDDDGVNEIINSEKVEMPVETKSICLEKESELVIETVPLKNRLSNEIDLKNETLVEPEMNKPVTSNEIHTNVPKKTENLNKSLTQIKEKTVTVNELIDLTKESNKLTRQATNVNQQMVEDCKELLRLFGVPWVVAPTEAEAQCATLEQLGFTDGTITDDSDIFLFGGKRVLKNFFAHSKIIVQYQLEDIQKFYGLDRSKLICLGMLCGTDYTVGIDGIGPVTSMELLSEFPGENMEPLIKFAEWYRTKLESSKNDAIPENKIRAKLLKFIVPSTFPNRIIFDAYCNANADNSLEPFSWSSPQLSELRLFASSRFGWSQQKTDSILLPVLKNLNQKEVQTKIDLYFHKQSKNVDVTERLRIKRSKRLNEAIRRNVKQSIDYMDSNETVKTNKRQQIVKRKKQQRKAKLSKYTENKPLSSDLMLSEDSSDSN